MKLGEALEVGTQITSALATAHAAGIVHRDIKPENIMLRPDGYVKVLDFGLAKLTERQALASDVEAATIPKVDTDPGTVMGTVNYMSPEQVRGLEVDARTDIFSLGVVLHEMIAGRAPFEGATQSDMIVSILEKEPPPLAAYSAEVPAELQRIVSKALRKDREERYQTVKDLLIDLKDLRQALEFEAKLERSLRPESSGEVMVATRSGETILGATRERGVRTGEGEAARPTSSAEYLVSEIKSHKRGVILTLATLGIAVAVLGYYVMSRNKGFVLVWPLCWLFPPTCINFIFSFSPWARSPAFSCQLRQSPSLG